jgi:hypothetical protein
MERTKEQGVETGDRIRAVLILRAVTPGLDHQDAFDRQPFAGKMLQTLFCGLREAGGSLHIETQLSRACDFIYVLPARSRTSYEVESQLRVASPDHIVSIGQWISVNAMKAGRANRRDVRAA